jgi:tRNA pseudouridine38-40 synthase
MVRLALLVAYDGTPYRGWTDLRDVALRPTLARLLGGDDPLLEAASRTDRGVHARGQVCSLALAPSASAPECGQLAYSLNQLLPAEVAVRAAAAVDDDFDVRANVGKEYVYRFSTRPGGRDPLRRLYEWHVPPRRGRPEWDASAADAAAAALRGTHSFAAFGNRPRGGERHALVDPVCELRELRLEAEPGGTWRLVVRGDRFLYKMVRNLAGALVRVGHGELSCDEVVDAVETGKFHRGSSVPLTAPAHGLVLQRVEYASDPFSGALPRDGQEAPSLCEDT